MRVARRAGRYEANSAKMLHAVGMRKPNGWGLHDMHGSVWEWCQDWHRQYEVVGQGVAVDPVAAEPASEGATCLEENQKELGTRQSLFLLILHWDSRVTCVHGGYIYAAILARAGCEII